MGDEIHKQYNLLVKDTAKLSDRRQTVNALYLSANSILLGAVAVVAAQSGLKPGILLLPAVLIALAGIPLCRDWRKLVLSNKELVGLRIKLLHEIEENSAFTYPIQTYHREDVLYDNPRRGVFGFSSVEINIPLIFIALYIVAILGAIALEVPNIVALLHGWGVLPR